jgi:hypothetical protein
VVCHEWVIVSLLRTIIAWVVEGLGKGIQAYQWRCAEAMQVTACTSLTGVLPVLHTENVWYILQQGFLPS